MTDIQKNTNTPKKSPFVKGYYTPKHPDKYVGNLKAKKIVYRSSWELDFCKFLDFNKNVIRWGSEEIAIPYIKPTDKRIHKYYPDFWVEYIDKDGHVIQEIIEIKPSTQVAPPSTVGKKPKQQLYEQLTYAINVAKWKACSEFCKKNGLKFRIITEQTQFK